MNPEALILDDLTDFSAYEDAECGKGLVERDLTTFPIGVYAAAPPAEIDVIDRAEWPERIADMEASRTRLSDIRATGMFGTRIPSLNQGRFPYCWAHGPTAAVILVRAAMHLSYVPLNAFSVACLANDWKISGGWSAQALETIEAVGIADMKYWPFQSTTRSNDNPTTRKNMWQHRVVESWSDLNAAVYDRNMTFEQKMTLLLTRLPVCNDYYWWGHAVVSMDPVNLNTLKDSMRTGEGKLMAAHEFDERFGVGGPADGYGSRDWNSWGDTYGENGEMIIAGNRSIPDNAVAPRSVAFAA